MKNFALLLLFLLPLGLSAQVQQYSDQRVAKIDIVVERASQKEKLDPNSIRAGLKTKVGENFSQLDFDEDLKNLSKEFDRVEPTLAIENGEVAITLRLWPRPIIRKIVFEGNSSIRSKTLLKELKIKTGTTFDRTEFNTNFRKLQEVYLKKGYFQAELTYRLEPDPSDNVVDIVICVNEGRSGRIKRIVFQGVSRKEQSELLDMIRTKKYFFLTSWMTHAGTYIEEMAEQDRFIVLNYLQNQGYADARVNLEVIERDNGLILAFRIDKGKPYTFGKITFEGNTLYTDMQIGRVIKLRRGQPYSPEKLRETVKAITDLYGQKGYIESVVTYEPHLSGNEPIYDVDFHIIEGEQYRVGVVKIFGNERTQQRVLRHESQLCPGDVFDIRKLQATEQTLRNIGYFDTVNVYTVRPSDNPLLGTQYRDVYIEVDECGTGSVSLNFGFSSLENVFAGLEITERNFCLAGTQRLFSEGPGALRGGGEYAQLKLNLGRKQSTLLASWTKPFFNDTCWIVGFDLERSDNKQVSDAYALRSTSVHARATYPINCFTSFGAHYRLVYTDLDLKKDPEKLSKDLEKQGQNQGAVSAIGFTLAYDSTDFHHTRGLRSLLEGEYAGVYGSYYFARTSYVNTYYLGLRDYCVLKLRGELRFVQSFMKTREKIPLTERLYLGGETTIRGYANYSVGPVFDGSDNARGGFSSLLLSAEVNKILTKQLQIFAFVDGGYVSFDPWFFRHLEWSVGFGARLNLMAQMPLFFGWGFPLNPDRKNEIQRFFFSVGGRF